METAKEDSEMIVFKNMFEGDPQDRLAEQTISGGNYSWLDDLVKNETDGVLRDDLLADAKRRGDVIAFEPHGWTKTIQTSEPPRPPWDGCPLTQRCNLYAIDDGWEERMLAGIDEIGATKKSVFVDFGNDGAHPTIDSLNRLNRIVALGQMLEDRGVLHACNVWAPSAAYHMLAYFGGWIAGGEYDASEACIMKAHAVAHGMLGCPGLFILRVESVEAASPLVNAIAAGHGDRFIVVTVDGKEISPADCRKALGFNVKGTVRM